MIRTISLICLCVFAGLLGWWQAWTILFSAGIWLILAGVVYTPLSIFKTFIYHDRGEHYGLILLAHVAIVWTIGSSFGVGFHSLWH